MRCLLIVLFLCCLADPSRLVAETAADYVERANTSLEKGEYDKAITDCIKAIAAANPNNPKDKQTIAVAYFMRGNAWGFKGEWDKAIADFSQELAIDPKNADAFAGRGTAWRAKEEYDKAIADYDQALVINPKDAFVYCRRGTAWEKKGAYDKAIADYRKGSAIDPDSPWGYDGMAWLYANCPQAKYRDGKKAVKNAAKALELSGGKDSACLDTLAAAYAESGDLAKARETEGNAIDLAPEQNKQEFHSRLELYKQGKPYHEPPVRK